MENVRVKFVNRGIDRATYAQVPMVNLAQRDEAINARAGDMRPRGDEEYSEDPVARPTFNEIAEWCTSDPTMGTVANIYRGAMRTVFNPDLLSYPTTRMHDFVKYNLMRSTKTPFMTAYFDLAPAHMCFFGNVLMEYLRTKRKTGKIVGFGTLDLTNSIDFIQDERGTVTRVGAEPKGWVQNESVEFINGTDVEWMTAVRLHYTKWAYGYGEFLFKILKSKANLITARQAATWRAGIPLPVVTYNKTQMGGLKEARVRAQDLSRHLARPKSRNAWKEEGTTIETYGDNGNGYKLLMEGEMQLMTNVAGVCRIPLVVLLMSTDSLNPGALDAVSEFMELSVKDMLVDIAPQVGINKAWRSGGGRGGILLDTEALLRSTRKEQILQIFRAVKGRMPLLVPTPEVLKDIASITVGREIADEDARTFSNLLMEKVQSEGDKLTAQIEHKVDALNVLTENEEVSE